MNQNLFQTCAPAISNSLDSCGSITRCDINIPKPSELDDIFLDANGDYRDMGALFRTRWEMKRCGARQNGLFDLLMSGARPMGKLVNKRSVAGGVPFIEPFVLARQRSVINDKFWSLANIAAGAGGTYNMHIRSRNSTTLLDPSYFPQGITIHLFGKTSAGTATRTQWLVNSADSSSYGGNSTIRVNATPQSSGTLGDATAKIEVPTAGVIILGHVNVTDWEAWCNNRPALNDNNIIPFFYGTSRWTLCISEQYRDWLKKATETNAYFKEFGDVSIQERNKQYSARYMEEWVNQFFWGKPFAGQTLENWKANLTQVSAATSQGLYFTGAGAGDCTAYKASPAGVYEQLADCGRVFDLQGQRLNIPELLTMIYDMMRAREGQANEKEFDLCTDQFTAFQLKQAFLNYLDNVVGGRLRWNINGEVYKEGKTPLGFDYVSFKVPYPQGVTINIITANFFDDFAKAANDEGVDSTGRFIWILDWERIYPGIIASNRKVRTIGDIEKMAQVDSSLACVMEYPTKEFTLNSNTWTAVVECGAANALLENFSTALPEHLDRGSPYTDLYSS